LGKETFERIKDEGRAMGMEEAIEYALEDPLDKHLTLTEKGALSAFKAKLLDR
jgi:hypothetical protein